MQNQPQQGYILLLTLLIISLLVVIVTQLYYRGSGHAAFADIMTQREKAKILAVSGIQLAISRLTVGEKEKTDKRLLERILPALNRFQIIDLKEDAEGIDGRVALCICCEDGKVNINKMYDFEKHQWIGQGQAKGDMKKVMFELLQRITQLTKSEKDLLPALEKFLRERKFPLNDVTELLTIPEFSYFNMHQFYIPPAEKETTTKKSAVYLTDVFTTVTEHAQIEPWLLSDSLCLIGGLRSAQPGDISQREQSISAWLKNFKANASWPQDWDMQLKPIYDKDFRSLPAQIASLFTSTFTAKMFSVISYGTVGQVTQHLFGILEMRPEERGAMLTLKKLYWI